MKLLNTSPPLPIDQYISLSCSWHNGNTTGDILAMYKESLLIFLIASDRGACSTVGCHKAQRAADLRMRQNSGQFLNNCHCKLSIGINHEETSIFIHLSLRFNNKNHKKVKTGCCIIIHLVLTLNK
jgi:hypothetical protein